jgi:glycosyltransferase involved in cell wall biosynthesis
VICTGGLSLRKGVPYLLEAFQLILKQEPGARLLLSGEVTEGMKPIMARYNNLPIDWAPSLPHPLLADRLRSADVFV